MKILLLGILIFCFAMLLHFLIWKIRVPKKQTTGLITIFTSVVLIWLIANSLNSALFIMPSILIINTLADQLHLCFFVISLALAYITTYSAIEVDSPSLRIVSTIAKAGSVGLEKEIFNSVVIKDDLLIKPRVKDLVLDNLIYLDADKYKLTFKGLLVTRIFMFYRKLLRRGKGG